MQGVTRPLPGYLFVFLVLLQGSCAVKPVQEPSVPVWPAPPEIPRVIYEATLQNADDLTPRTSVQRLRQIAVGQDESSTAPLMRKPYDVAARGGRIVVSDTLAAVAHVWDVPRRKVFAIGWRGEGKLGQPLGVAIDDKQNIYVVDGIRNQVIQYDPLGLFNRFIGEPERFEQLSDVAVAIDGSLLLLDRGSIESERHRLAIYSENAEFVRFVGSRGYAEGEFNHPTQVEVSTDGEIYVLDAGNFRIQVFSLEGQFKRTWGTPGQFLGQMARPRGLALAPNGTVLVSDTAFQNVQIFSRSGELLMTIGGGEREPGPGRYLLPAGLEVDETGRIYIADQMTRRIEVLRFLTDNEIRDRDESTLQRK